MNMNTEVWKYRLELAWQFAKNMVAWFIAYWVLIGIPVYLIDVLKLGHHGFVVNFVVIYFPYYTLLFIFARRLLLLSLYSVAVLWDWIRYFTPPLVYWVRRRVLRRW